MEELGAMTYSNVAGSADFAGLVATVPTPAAAYASLAAAITALTAVYAHVEEFKPTAGRPIRAVLSLAMAGSAGNTFNEDLYLAVPSNEDGVQGIGVQKAGSMVWTKGTGVLVGPRSGHTQPSGVVLTATGVVAALTGRELQVISQAPGGAGIVLYDIGPCVGLIRVFSKPASGGATGVAPRIQTWR
ncbi:MAG: hypothetical protein ABL966_10980 [Acidimicrobiales bacterium]